MGWVGWEKFFRRPNGDQTDHRMRSQVENPGTRKRKQKEISRYDNHDREWTRDGGLLTTTSTIATNNR